MRMVVIGPVRPAAGLRCSGHASGYAPAGPDEATLGTGDAGARIGCGVVQGSNRPPSVETPPLPDARAMMVNTDGAHLGEVTFAERSHGLVQVRASVDGLPPGGFHGCNIHGTGACQPDFAAAGSHYNPASYRRRRCPHPLRRRAGRTVCRPGSVNTHSASLPLRAVHADPPPSGRCHGRSNCIGIHRRPPR